MRDNVWPTRVEELREHLYGMFEDLDALKPILRAIARYLSWATTSSPTRSRWATASCACCTIRRFRPMPGVRAEAHEDINVITLLLGAEEAGLQLRGRQLAGHRAAAWRWSSTSATCCSG